MEQTTATPIAAVAGAMAMRGNGPMLAAANAPSAEAGARPAARDQHASRPAPEPWRGPDTQMPAFPPDGEPPTGRALGGGSVPPPPRAANPMYASGPRRVGFAALLIALCAATALVAFAIWKLSRDATPAAAVADPARDASVMAAFPPDATPPPMARAPDTPPAAPAVEEPARAISPPAHIDPDLAAPPVEIKPLPAKPARRNTGIAAPPKAAAIAPPPPVVAEPVPVSVRPPVVAPAPRVQPDRWAQMRDEQSRCTREDFIARVICDQRVRFRYCNGYWGKSPQCPGSPTPERGQ